MTAPAVKLLTSQCCASVISRSRAYSSARRMSNGSCTPLPSSVNNVTPASRSSLYGANACPARPTVMQPDGTTSHSPARTPCERTNSTTIRESCEGSVLGIATTAVNPPKAAALLPVSMVSDSSRPGSRRCTWRSTKPGETMQPVASRSKSAFGNFDSASTTSAITPPDI